MQKIINRSSLLWLTCLVFSLTVRAQKGKPAYQSTHSYSNGSTFLCVNDDSSYTPMRTLIVYKDGPLYNITMAGNKVLDLSVNGRTIPPDSFYVYDAMIKKLNEQIKKDRIQAKLDQEQAIKDQGQAILDHEQAMRDQAQAMRDQAQAMRDQEQAGRDKIQAEMDKVQAQREKIQAERDRSEAEEGSREAKEEAERDRVEAERDRIEARRDKVQAERDQEQAKRDKIQAEEDEAIFKSIIREVVKDGLAPDEKSVTSLYFDKDELIVNGKKPSDELQKKYRAKFLIRPGYSISYRR